MLCYAFAEHVVNGFFGTPLTSKDASPIFNLDLVTSEILTKYDTLECLYGNAETARSAKSAFINLGSFFQTIQSAANKGKKLSVVGDFKFGNGKMQNLKIIDRRDEALYLGLQSGKVLICCGPSKVAIPNDEEPSAAEKNDAIDEQVVPGIIPEDEEFVDYAKNADQSEPILHFNEAATHMQDVDKPDLQQPSELCQQLLSFVKSCKVQNVKWSPEVCDSSEQNVIDFC